MQKIVTERELQEGVRFLNAVCTLARERDFALELAGRLNWTLSNVQDGARCARTALKDSVVIMVQ